MATLLIVVNFLIILSFLVIIHELGHFLTAKKSGIKVEEFGMGYPPKALTLYTDKEGTEYTLNWLPFGGFVRMYGEDGDISEDSAPRSKAFFSQPVWQRLIVVFAGALMNFVFGALAFGGIYTYLGEVPEPLGYVEVVNIEEGSPAALAGLKEGDRIVAVVDEGQREEVDRSAKLIDLSSKNLGEDIVLILENGEEVSVNLRSEEQLNEGLDQTEKRGAIGVGINDTRTVEYPLWQLPFQGMRAGLREAVDFMLLIYNALGGMVSQLVVAGEVPQEVSGPVGVADQAVEYQLITPNLFTIQNLVFAAILSLNLAAINVIPLPALDGGRAVFLFVEAIIGRRIKPEIEQWVNAAGFILLVGLLILITVRDVSNLFKGVSFLGWF